MSEEEFEAILDLLPGGKGAGRSVERAKQMDEIPLEKLRQILDGALIRLHPYRRGISERAMESARLLFREGVAPTDAGIVQMVEMQVSSPTSQDFALLPELVGWVERAETCGELSIRALTSLRRLPESLLRRSCDRDRRILIKRLAIALNLTEDAVIPKAVDGWTATALEKREELAPDSRERWDKLLALANDQQTGKPGKTYMAKAQAIVGSLPEFPIIMEAILQSIGRDGPVGVRFRGFPSPMKNLLDDDYTSLLRALIWLCAPFPELRPALREAAERSITKIRNLGPLSAKVAAACAYALSHQDDTSAVRAVFELQTGARHKTTKKAVRDAIATIEARTGTPSHILEESVVPDFGFTPGAVPHRVIAEETVFLTCTKASAPILLLEEPNRRIRGRRQGERIARTKDAKSLLREIRKAWRQEVLRLERLMRQDRVISAKTWEDRYLAHPIVGLISRRLLWRADEKLIAFAAPEDPERWPEISTVDDAPFRLTGGEMIRLWHPCELTEPDRQTWERWVLDRRLVQPFQQALRSVYRPEDGHAFADARYAGELLQQRTLYAVTRERGWNYGIHESTLRYEAPPLPHHPAIVASVELGEVVEPSGEAGQSGVWQPIIDVSFRVDNRAVALADVPRIIFSEVMRDLDLFIAASRSSFET